MQSSLKKSLYLGLAALSFGAVAATTTNASAKTYAKTAQPYTTLKTAASDRNVAVTGSNALYTKPGTLKGAKVVATKTTMKNLAASKQGQKNFRAYGVKTTNRGSVYYKVVSFDKQYRGYIYGGKSTSAFAGGLTSYATTKDATAPKDENYKLSAATSTTENKLFYKAPAWTQYKIGRAVVNGSVLKSTDAYKNATLKFNKAVTTSREGDLWYQVSSVNGSTTNGLVGAWVKASNVKSEAAVATENNSVNIKYVDGNNNTVGTSAFVVNSNLTKKGDKVNSLTNTNHDGLWTFAQANVPSGYAVDKTANPITDPAKQEDATIGGTYVVHVVSEATTKVNFYVDAVNNDAVKDHVQNNGDVDGVDASDTLVAGTKINDQIQVKSLTSNQAGWLNGKTGTAINLNGVFDALFDAGAPLNTLEGTKTYQSKAGYDYHYTYKLTKHDDNQSYFTSDNRLANYGDTLKASYTATLVPGAASAASNGNTDYIAK